MTATTQEFNPRWACSPGVTIRDLMKSKHTKQEVVAEACGLTPIDFDELLQGSAPITEQVARSLSTYLGGSVSFWLRREERFREMKATVEADQWVQSLPLSSMKKLNWLEVPRDWRTRIDACFSYFGVKSLEEWHQNYSNQLQAVRFRTSPTFKNQIASVSSWLRAGEIANQEYCGGKFDRDALASRLTEMRNLTRTPNPAHFMPQLQSITTACGVSCLIVPTPEGCAASGASRILSDGSALIQLSGRFLSDDQFWFSFFHEVGHLLLHREAPLHVDGDPAAIMSSKAESEANSFSADVLWALEDRPHLSATRKPSRRDVIRMANRVDTSPGIIVGQLQNDGILDYSEYNNLKRRYIREGSRLLLKR